MDPSASAEADAAAPSPSPPAAASKKSPAVAVPLRLPHRVADYFLVVGGVRQEQDHPKSHEDADDVLPPFVSVGVVGTNPHRKSGKKTAWTARVLDRYPRTDFKDAEFPRDVEMFCFPSAYELSPLCHAPEPHCFVLTEADGTRVYGCALRFWEPVDEARLAALERGLEHGFTEADEATSGHAASASPPVDTSSGPLVYAPKALVIVSHWPFLSNFERFLSMLHKNLYIHSDGNLVPVERVIANFIHEVPLPPQGKFEVESRSFLNPFFNTWLNSCPWATVPTNAGSIEKKVPFLFSRPPPNKAPLRDFPLSTIFRWLSLENIFTLYAAVLTERRILFVSDKLYKLTIAAESITYLLCPFYWRHIYIPLLPSRLTDFICAPMPYIVGIHRNNMPDELLLDQVVVVDLDQNTITATNADPIPPLPTERQASLSRHLKKLVIDPTTPLKPTQNMADSDIEAAFFKFHVRLFANYRDYLEAPSEFVVDKFQKARFCAEHAEKGPFLQEFMETQMFQCFVDDRYDQSTRALAGKGAAAANLEVLFFDETIDESLGKPAPFLQDSSQNIQSQSRVIALAPNTDGLPKGALYKYDTLPVPLSAKLFGEPREVKDLAGDGDQAHSGGGGDRRRFGMDMEKVSMKFFQEKRLYSQHFHTLRLRSAKQDTAFKDVCAYFRGEQAVEEATIHDMERMTAATVDKDTPDTGTTLDSAWLFVRRSVQEQLAAAAESFRAVREDVALPLYTCCSEGEHQLKILFAEAHTLEAKAAKGKAVVERAKAASMASFARYESMKETMRQRILTASEVSRIVAAQNDSEDARLDLDESETSFHTIVSEYEQRMPQIIASIRQLNKERIVQLRASLSKWVENRRANLRSQLAQLDRVNEAVEAIDGDKDLTSFSEGTTDFWAAARGTIDTAAAAHAMHAKKPSNTPSVTTLNDAAAGERPSSTSPKSQVAAPVSSPMLASSPPSLSLSSNSLASLSLANGGTTSASSKPSLALKRGSELTTLLCYPLSLWGIDGFERAASQATLTRKVMKELIGCLMAWVEVLDLKSKKLTTLVRSVPELPTNPSLSSGQRALWECLKQRGSITSRAYTDFQMVLLKLVSDLNLTKGELKMSITRFREHRIKLEKEVATANDVLLRSMEKKDRTARALLLLQKQLAASPTPSGGGGATTSGAFPAVVRGGGGAAVASSSTPDTLLSPGSISGLMSQKQLELQSQQLERISREAKEAEHEYTLNSRNSDAIQRKHDICVSRLLRLFEKKERYCLNELRKTFSVLAEQFHALLITNYRRGDEAVALAVKKIDMQAEMKEFVENAGGKVPPGPPPPPGTSGASTTSTTVVDFGRHLGSNGYSAAAGLLQTHIAWVRATNFLLEELSLTDDLEVKALKKASFKVRSCRPGTTLQSAVMSFEQLLDRVTEITDDNVRVVHDLAQPFAKLKSSLKALAKTHETKWADIEKTYRRAVEERDRAVAAEKACDDALKLAHAKTEQATRDEESSAAAGGKKGLFSSFMSTPLRDLQSKESQAVKELEKAQAATADKESALLIAVTRRAEDLRLLLQDMQSTDAKRWNSQCELTNSLVTKHSLHVDKMQTLLHNFSTRVADMTADADVANFLSKNATTQNRPPEWVRDDYVKYVDAVAMQAAESERMRQAAARQAARETEAAPSALPDVTPAVSPSPAPLPATTHHGYSNSTSLAHIRPTNHVVTAVPPPPVTTHITDFASPTRARAATTHASPPPNRKPPPPLPVSASASIVSRRDSLTSHTSPTGTVDEEPSSSAVHRVSEDTSRSTSQGAAARPQVGGASTEEKSKSARVVYEFSQSVSQQSSIAPTATAESAAANAEEYQDENGDWIKRHHDEADSDSSDSEPEESNSVVEQTSEELEAVVPRHRELMVEISTSQATTTTQQPTETVPVSAPETEQTQPAASEETVVTLEPVADATAAAPTEELEPAKSAESTPPVSSEVSPDSTEPAAATTTTASQPESDASSSEGTTPPPMPTVPPPARPTMPTSKPTMPTRLPSASPRAGAPPPLPTGAPKALPPGLPSTRPHAPPPRISRSSFSANSGTLTAPNAAPSASTTPTPTPSIPSPVAENSPPATPVAPAESTTIAASIPSVVPTAVVTGSMLGGADSTDSTPASSPASSPTNADASATSESAAPADDAAADPAPPTPATVA